MSNTHESVFRIPVTAKDLPVIPPPPRFSKTEMHDLKAVIKQMANPITSRALSDVYDVTFLDLYKVYLDSKGKSYNTEYYENIQEALLPLIMEVKALYGRPRPEPTALSYGIKLPVYETDTSSSPSYPSGHAMQAYTYGNLLSYQFPEYKDDLMQISDLICHSRIDHGLHFNSDIIFGKMLGKLIASAIIDEHYPSQE